MPAAPDGPLLELSDVTVRYGRGGAVALDGVSLTVSAGERVALVGPSGAGKTTVLSLANGLVLPTTGTVRVLGVDSRRLGARAERATRRLVGTVPQGNALVGPLRVAQNVAAGRLGRWGALEALRTLVRPRDLDEIVDVLRRVGIADKLWERADRLSGGQQQRVAIARALFQGARLLLADEPVSALDPGRSADVLDVLRRAVDDDPGRALVSSLHDAPLAVAASTRIVALRDGRIVFDLPAADVDGDRLDRLYEIERS